MPEHIWSGVDAATFANSEPIGTGPYTFTSAATNRAVWDRDDNWWGAKTGFMDLPEPKRLIWLESGGEESRAQLMATEPARCGAKRFGRDLRGHQGAKPCRDRVA